MTGGKSLIYFDMLTQVVFDIYSHLKFVQAFKGALIGKCNEDIIVQYRSNTGVPSPGVVFY